MAPREAAQTPDRSHVQSLARGLRVVQCFGSSHSRLTLEEAAERASFSRSATRRLLRTLVASGYADFDGHRYGLTPKLLELGYLSQSRLSLADVARPHCEALAAEVQSPVALAVLDGRDVVFLLRAGTGGVMSVAIGVGTRLPAHLTAIGRAMLAWLPEDELAAYFAERPLSGPTTRSVTSEQQLRANLLRVRADGWAAVDQELEAGLSAVAAPIRDRRGQVMAAVNVSSHGSSADNTKRRDELVGALQRATAQIGVDLHPAHFA